MLLRNAPAPTTSLTTMTLHAVSSLGTIVPFTARAEYANASTTGLTRAQGLQSAYARVFAGNGRTLLGAKVVGSIFDSDDNAALWFASISGDRALRRLSGYGCDALHGDTRTKNGSGRVIVYRCGATVFMVTVNGEARAATIVAKTLANYMIERGVSTDGVDLRFGGGSQGGVFAAFPSGGDAALLNGMSVSYDMQIK